MHDGHAWDDTDGRGSTAGDRDDSFLPDGNSSASQPGGKNSTVKLGLGRGKAEEGKTIFVR